MIRVKSNEEIVKTLMWELFKMKASPKTYLIFPSSNEEINQFIENCFCISNQIMSYVC